MKTKTLRNFFVITFIWAWVLWMPFVLPSFGLYEMTETLEGLVMLAVMIGAFGPLIAAMILTYRDGGKEKVRQYFRKCLNFKIKPIYYLMAILLGLVITAAAHYLTNLSGLDNLPNNLIPEGINIPIYVLIIPYLLMLFILGGGQEEFGWRGFAQEPMQERLGVLKGSILIGLIWSLWHLPLWFIIGEGHSYYPFLAFMLYATSWSVIIGIMYNLSGKKMVVAWIMHAVGNLSVPLFPVLFLEDVPQPGYWVWAILNLLVAAGMVIWVYYRKQEVLGARL
ncbi:MAG: CPBP family intramembrane metalloprotease [Acholeplasmataceae bacterium]|nr:CPBP family intramembrane metalloprotease [Acholeplasmataceae bacterium]